MFILHYQSVARRNDPTHIVPAAPSSRGGGNFVHFTLPINGKKERPAHSLCLSTTPCAWERILFILHCISGRKERTDTLTGPAAPPFRVGGNFVFLTLLISGKKERTGTLIVPSDPPLARGREFWTFYTTNQWQGRTHRHNPCAYRPPLARGREFFAIHRQRPELKDATANQWLCWSKRDNPLLLTYTCLLTFLAQTPLRLSKPLIASSPCAN